MNEKLLPRHTWGGLPFALSDRSDVAYVLRKARKSETNRIIIRRDGTRTEYAIIHNTDLPACYQPVERVITYR